MARLTVAWPRARSQLLLLTLLLVAPAILAISQALPEEGFGLAVRLGAAACCVLLLPGALVVRALGWPADLGIALASALAWSLGLGFVALAVTFATGRSLTLALVLVAAAAGAALIAALVRRAPTPGRADALALAGLVLAGLALGALVWWHAESVGGDGLFHLGRMRKLAELESLPGLASVNEFADGSLHPGYAFPLWHGELALVARLADVDVARVVLYLPALLVPLALGLAYAMGRALFGSWAGGVAVASAQAGTFAFARAGLGSFPILSLPATAALVLLVPALLALAFAYVRERRVRELVALAIAALALVAIHPTYAIFVCVPLAGFVVARLVLAWRDGVPDAVRTVLCLGCVLLPTAAFLAWLAPTVDEAASFRPTAAQRTEDFEHYATQLAGSPDGFHVAPEAISRGGAIVVLGLVALPALALARRSRFAAFALGGTLALLLVLLVDPLFTQLSDVVSLSQSRRLIRFLPAAVAVAGLAVALGRARAVGVAVAAGLGAGAMLLYPAETGYAVERGGPAWAVWAGLAGGGLALLGARLVPWQLTRGSARWTALAGVALVVPLAVDGLRQVRQEPRDRHALSAGLVAAVRAQVGERDVVFADLETSYRLAAAAPLAIAAAPPSHVAATARNRPLERRADVTRFFYRDGVANGERAAIAASYRASWLVVRRAQLAKRPELAQLGTQVHADGAFVLLRLPKQESA